MCAKFSNFFNGVVLLKCIRRWRKMSDAGGLNMELV